MRRRARGRGSPPRYAPGRGGGTGVGRPAWRPQTGGPFIHSYPQVFPYPQPAHILGITRRGTATH